MKRHFFEHRNVQLSYLDAGNDAPVDDTPILLALHGHFGCARNFAPLAAALAPHYRVIALDQRGHGWSSHPEDCSRDAYIADVLAWIAHLQIAKPVAILGHSLGGINAYQFAARHPERVSKLVVEDIGTRVARMVDFAADWPHRYDSLPDLLALLQAKGLGGDRHFLDSAAEFEDGWGFRFDPQWMARSQRALAGEYRDDWRSLRCPTLLIRGSTSWATREEDLRWMQENHLDCRYQKFNAGHTIHDELPEQFNAAVKDFLSHPSA
jgi:pimeloyl-ACP methyl ester carboxylesterase